MEQKRNMQHEAAFLFNRYAYPYLLQNFTNTVKEIFQNVIFSSIALPTNVLDIAEMCQYTKSMPVCLFNNFCNIIH